METRPENTWSPSDQRYPISLPHFCMSVDADREFENCVVNTTFNLLLAAHKQHFD